MNPGNVVKSNASTQQRVNAYLLTLSMLPDSIGFSALYPIFFMVFFFGVPLLGGGGGGGGESVSLLKASVLFSVAIIIATGYLKSYYVSLPLFATYWAYILYVVTKHVMDALDSRFGLEREECGGCSGLRTVCAVINDAESSFTLKVHAYKAVSANLVFFLCLSTGHYWFATLLTCLNYSLIREIAAEVAVCEKPNVSSWTGAHILSRVVASPFTTYLGYVVGVFNALVAPIYAMCFFNADSILAAHVAVILSCYHLVPYKRMFPSALPSSSTSSSSPSSVQTV